VIVFSLGLVRLAAGLALRLPAVAKNESPAGSCSSQSRWELLGSQSEVMERDTMCNSSLWTGDIGGDRWISPAKERRSQMKML